MQISPMDTDIDLGQLFGAGTVTVFVMDWIKRTAWIPWINQHSDTLNRVVSLIVAVVTATGIKMVSTGTLHAGGTITITFPAMQVIVNTLVHGGGQFGWQELLHKALGNHAMNKQILALLQGGPPPAPPAAPAPGPAPVGVIPVAPAPVAPPPPANPGGH